MLPWHKKIINQIDLLKKRSKVPNGIILKGHVGIGKNKLAKAIAKAFISNEHSDDPRASELRIIGHQTFIQTYILSNLRKKRV